MTQPLAVALDTGKGLRRTVIEGQVNEQRDRFSMPLAGAAVELWSGDALVETTHADVNGHFVFTKDLMDGDYLVQATACPDAQVRVSVLRERHFNTVIQFATGCGKAQN